MSLLQSLFPPTPEVPDYPTVPAWEIYVPRVERGIARLDGRGPSDWRSRVVPDGLDMASPYCCTLGQVYERELDTPANTERYTDGFQLGIVLLGLSFADLIECGFDLSTDAKVDVNRRRYGELTEAWRRVLEDVTT